MIFDVHSAPSLTLSNASNLGQHLQGHSATEMGPDMRFEAFEGGCDYLEPWLLHVARMKKPTL